MAMAVLACPDEEEYGNCRTAGEILNALFEISDCGIVPVGGIMNIEIENLDRKFWR